MKNGKLKQSELVWVIEQGESHLGWDTGDSRSLELDPQCKYLFPHALSN